MFEVAEAYERQRGRSSKILAPLFVDFVGIRGEVLDVGCGTGALTFAIAKKTAVSKIVGVDLSEGFLAYARSTTDDPRIRFEQGDAQELPFADNAFDCCLALLVVGFLPDAPEAAREMRRVTRHGGIVATAWWDNSAGNELNQSLWDAARSLDPKGLQVSSGLSFYGSAETLSSLWASVGLTNIDVKNIVFPCGFDSFNDYWQPLTEGQGPDGNFIRGFSEEQRITLRERLRQNLFGDRADGPFSLTAKAWAVKDIVPA
jgi:ubiquinone/menaquinone biosynthesis C-methylase UbiE